MDGLKFILVSAGLAPTDCAKLEGHTVAYEPESLKISRCISNFDV
jgi:hypothetical protein